MASVDERIVSIQFDNSGFERKLGETISSLDKLSETIKLVGAQQGFDAVSAAANSFDTSNMASAIDNISSHFTALGAIGFSVIQKLTQDVISFVESTVKEDILGPILTGGKKRALNIEQAKFQFRGLGVDIEQGMESALAAVRGTAFGLDEAAKAASQLAASGIAVGPQMTGILRGIAGTAAMTGSTFSEMSDIFTASAGSGKVNTQDLLQFSTRGLNAAAALAKQMGLTEAQVREMASEGKLDFQTFATAMDGAFGAHATKANETYEGSLANVRAALSRLGASFFGQRLEQQRDVFNSIMPVIDKVNAALQPLVKTFLELTSIATFKIVDFFNNLDLTNFTAAIPNFAAGLKNIFGGIAQFFGTIKDAFREIFPPSSVSILLKISEGFKSLSEKFKMGAEAAENFKSIFRGVFSVIEIGWTIIKEFYKTFAELIKVIFPAAGGLLKVGAAGGDFLTKMNEILVAGGGIHKFFEKLRDVIKGPIEFISELREKIGALAATIAGFFSKFTGDDTGAAELGLGRVDSRLDQMRDTADKVSSAWERLTDRFKGVFDIFDKVLDYIKNWFSELGSKIAAAFQPGDFNAAADIVSVGLLGGIAVMVKRLLTGGFKLDLGEGLFEKMGVALDTITEKTKAMTTSIKADTLLKIAGALALLTASIVVLSLIDSGDLAKALAAVGVGLLELIGIMTLMEKISGPTGTLKLTVLGIVLIELSVAMLILSAAIKNLSSLSMAELSRGLYGIAAGLTIMIVGMKAISKDPAGLIRAGIAMIIISTGLLILSKAVQSFATMSWGEMAKGLIGVGIGLGLVTLALMKMPPESVLSGLGFIEIAIGLNILALAVKSFAVMPFGEMVKGLAGIGIGLALITLALNFMPAMSVISGLGFIAVAVGLNILYPAVKLFSTLSWGEMLKGMVGIGAGLLIIAAAMHLMPLTMILIGPALIVVATALGMLAGVLRLIGTMDLGDLVKGIIGFAAMLIILAGAMMLMQGAMAGAAALVVVSGAMFILANVLEKIGNLSIEQLIIALAGIAGVLIILGLAAAILQPLIPALLGLGVALGLVGASFALFGIGAMLVAKSFEMMAESGLAGAKAIVGVLDVFIAALPKLATAWGVMLIGILNELLAAVPLLIRLVTAVLDQLLTTIIDLAPKIADALIAVIGAILKILREKFPEYVQTGLDMLLALLRGIRDNIGEIVTVVAEIITKFIDALSEKVDEIADSVVNFLLTVAEEVARKAGEQQTAFIPIGIAFMEGLLSGLKEGAEKLFTFFRELPGKILDIIKALFGIESPSTVFKTIGIDLILGLLQGLGESILGVMNWFIELPGKILGWIGNVASTLIPIGWDLIFGLITGIGEKALELMNWFVGLPGTILGWIVDAASWLKDTGINIIAGLLSGLAEKIWDVFLWLLGLPAQIIGYIPNPLKILVDVGKNLVEGLIDGIEAAWEAGKGAVDSVVDGVLNKFNRGFLNTSPSRVMAEVGFNVMKGFELGIISMKSSLMKASGSIVDSVISGFDSDNLTKSISASLNKVTDQLSGMDEFNPVITPVLDLTKVEEASKNLENYMRLAPITPEVSLDRARLVAATATVAGEVTPPVYTGPTEVTFEQNIYAPTELSTNDIYRNTKSQIVLAREKLGIK